MKKTPTRPNLVAVRDIDRSAQPLLRKADRVCHSDRTGGPVSGVPPN